MKDYRLLTGKAAIITGSGRGIGRAIAGLFADHGASVVINDIDQDVAETAAREIGDMGGRAIVCAGSVTDVEYPDRLVHRCADQVGGVGIIDNNAGYTWPSAMLDISNEQ